MSVVETISDSLCRNDLFVQTYSLISCQGGWSQAILQVKNLDVELLGWCGYTWSAVVRLIVLENLAVCPMLKAVYGREINIQFSGLAG